MSSGVGNAVAGVICADGHLGYAQPVGGVIAYGITRAITRPMNEAVRVAQTVAAGDLTSPVHRLDPVGYGGRQDLPDGPSHPLARLSPGCEAGAVEHQEAQVVVDDATVTSHIKRVRRNHSRHGKRNSHGEPPCRRVKS